jgi:KEOPS complex subunit Pcc1
MRRAVVRLQGGKPGVLHDALAPEAGRDVPGARVHVAREGDDVVVRIDADDTGTLRAALNSYLRWAQLAGDVQDAVRE